MTEGAQVIARTWRGVVRAENADTYADYIRDTGFREYGENAGQPGRRDAAQGRG